MNNLENFKFNVTQFFNKYKVIDINQLLDKNYLIIDENEINKILREANDINKDNFVFIVDSNLGINHALDSFGIIEKKITKENLSSEIAMVYIPLNIGYNNANQYTKEKMIENKENNVSTLEELDSKVKEINPNKVIENIAKEFKDKNVRINESFVNYIHLDKIFKQDRISFNDLSNQNLKEKLNSINKSNDEKLNLMEANPNIKLYKSAGNYVHNSSNNNEKEKLKEILMSLNGTYETLKSISTIMVNLIEAKLLDKDISKLEEQLNNLFKVKTLAKYSKEEFIDLYIKDYFANYESYNLLKKINQRGIDNLKIVEATNENVIIENYKLYKKLNKDFKIDELENLTNNLSYSLEETEKILEIYNKYKDQYPLIFKVNELGSFTNLINHDTIGYKVGIDGQDGTTMLRSNTGTSAASPMILVEDFSNEIKQKKKDLEKLQEQEIIEEENSFISRY